MWDSAESDHNNSLWWQRDMDYIPLPALRGEVTADVAIIGGGFTGVSTALHLAQRYPERRIILLEARHLGFGASGRNGGLMLNWLGGSLPDDEAALRREYDITRSGIDLIENVIQTYAPGTRYRRDGSLELFTQARQADAAAAEVERLQAVGVPVQYLSGPALARYLDCEGVVGAVFDPTAGHLEGADYLRRLRPALLGLGVGIYEQAPVQRIEEGRTISLTTPGGRVRAGAIVLATNAYTPRLGYFRAEVVPLLAHVAATQPYSPSEWAALGWAPNLAGFHDDRGRVSYGCMTLDGRLVVGGGSNAAYHYGYGGHTAGRTPASASAAIRRCLAEYLPRAAQTPFTHTWTGPLALTWRRIGAMGVRGEQRNVFYALGYSGHGITLSNLAGQVLCDLYSQDDSRWRGLAFYNAAPARLPGEPLRWVGYQVYTRLTGRSPRPRA